MPVNRQKLFFLFCVFLVFFIIIFYINQNKSSIGYSLDYNTNELNDYIWDGLPISINNNVYHDPNTKNYSSTYKRFVDLLRTFSVEQWRDDDILWENTVDNYFPYIGWNGIFDGIELVLNENDSVYPSRFHWYGEKLYEMIDEPRYGIEVAARDILHKAPLHGVIWQIIFNYGINDTEALFKLIGEEMCYFKNEENFGSVWISCIHGVGHGFANIYGTEDIGDALELCSYSDDGEFQYACSSGIFMSLVPEYEISSQSPCNNNLYPASCYRFKPKQFFSKTNPCAKNGLDEYHKMGCAWGEAYVIKTSPFDVANVCSKYIPKNGEDDLVLAACVDGFLQIKVKTKLKEKSKQKLCGSFMNYTTAYETCLYYADTNLSDFTFSNETNIYYYNSKLLEAKHKNNK